MDQIERFTDQHETGIVERSDGTSYIEGYAIRFYSPTDPGTEYQLGGGKVERVERSAVANVLQQAEPVECRFNHSRDFVLGTTETGLTLTIDDRGLRYSLPYDPQDPDHQKVRAKIKKGLIKGSSFSALARSMWQQEGDRAIRKIVEIGRLDDVSVVDRPAYRGSTCVIRSEQQTDIEREYQDWQRRQQETETRLQKLAEITI